MNSVNFTKDFSEEKACCTTQLTTQNHFWNSAVLPKAASKLVHWYPCLVHAQQQGWGKALICSVCHFLSCKYPIMVIFKLSMWHPVSQNWENLCIIGSHKPLLAALLQHRSLPKVFLTRLLQRRSNLSYFTWTILRLHYQPHPSGIWKSTLPLTTETRSFSVLYRSFKTCP